MPTPPSPRTSTRAKEAAASDQIDFRGMYYTLRERAWVIGLCLLIAALSTTAYVIRAPRIYEAKLVL